MYLLVMEDGKIWRMSALDEGYMANADDGILDIIDISGDVPLQYYDGKWNEISEYKE